MAPGDEEDEDGEVARGEEVGEGDGIPVGEELRQHCCFFCKQNLWDLFFSLSSTGRPEKKTSLLNFLVDIYQNTNSGNSA